MPSRYSNRRLKTFCCRCGYKLLITIILFLCFFPVQLAHSDPAFFNTTSSTINIPTVSVAGTVYTDIVLQLENDNRFSIKSVGAPLSTGFYQPIDMAIFTQDDGQLKISTIAVDGQIYPDILMNLENDGRFALISIGKNILSKAGLWAPVENLPGASIIDFWSIVKLGSNQLEGVVLTGWVFTEWGNTATDITPVNVALLGQQPDGSLKIVTDQYLPSAVTNGAGSVNVADFNSDGQDDIFLAAHNESPMISKASTVYLSKADSTFSKITLQDSVTAHHANLAYIKGVPTILATTFSPNMKNPIYTYNGQGGFDINNSLGSVSAMSVAAADFLGDGGTQIVYGDLLWGAGVPWSLNNTMQQFIYNFVNGKLIEPPISLPAPYFNNKPQYDKFISNWDPFSKTHSSRVWADDINNDGKSDIVVGAEIWDTDKGLQKTILQLLVNQGNLNFIDETDTLIQQWNQGVHYDYSLRMADVDQSGIKTYFLSQDPLSELINGIWTPQNSRQGNYILVNNGTGKFHVAMHDEFVKLGDYVNQYLAQEYAGSSVWADGIKDTPRFIAYQTPTGLINFVAAVNISDLVNGKWIRKIALVNVPLSINIKNDFRTNLTVTDRNGSHLIRTFAGNDLIYSGNSGGYCAIDGGLGVDTIVYSGKKSNYTINKTLTGYVVKDNFGNDGVDTLTNIQKLQFSNATIDL